MVNMFFVGYFIRAAIEYFVEERYGMGIFFLVISVMDLIAYLIACWRKQEKEKNDGGWI